MAKRKKAKKAKSTVKKKAKTAKKPSAAQLRKAKSDIKKFHKALAEYTHAVMVLSHFHGKKYAIKISKKALEIGKSMDAHERHHKVR